MRAGLSTQRSPRGLFDARIRWVLPDRDGVGGGVSAATQFYYLATRAFSGAARYVPAPTFLFLDSPTPLILLSQSIFLAEH